MSDSPEHRMAAQLGIDPYDATARRLFGVDKPNPEQRRCARAAQFANLYGASPALIDSLLRGGLR